MPNATDLLLLADDLRKTVDEMRSVGADPRIIAQIADAAADVDKEAEKLLRDRHGH
jgi:hypothetical protein